MWLITTWNGHTKAWPNKRQYRIQSIVLPDPFDRRNILGYEWHFRAIRERRDLLGGVLHDYYRAV